MIQFAKNPFFRNKQIHTIGQESANGGVAKRHPRKWMFAVYGTVLLGLTVLSARCQDGSGRAAQQEPPKEVVQYLAGMEVLNASALPPAAKAERQRQLQTITGTTPEEAAPYLAAMRSNPQKWKKLQERMLEALRESQQSKE